MKTKLYTAIAILSMAFGMTACSSSDDVNENGNETVTGNQYMKVTVITGNGNQSYGAKAHTRAEYTNNSGLYHNGSNVEGHLNTVRFYFFDTQGEPIAMNNYSTGNANYVATTFADTDNGSEGDQNLTVERRYATLVLDPVNGQVPAQVVAIANPGSISNVDDLNNKSLTNLSNGTSRQTTTSFYDSNNHNFAMSSSVYTETNNTPSFAASTAGKITTSRDDTSTPVEVYVERIAAKVLAAKGGASTNWIKVKETNATNHTWGTSTDTDAKDAYVIYDGTGNDENYSLVDASGTHTTYRVIAVINGWGLADEQDNAYVMKNIDRHDNWTQSYLGFVFSLPQLHRSYWETTPTNETRTNHTWEYYTNGEAAPQNLNTTNSESDSYTPNAMYTMPNTPAADMIKNAFEATGGQVAYFNQSPTRTRLTKLLVAATLLYSTDNGATYQPATICRYGGVNYLTEDQLKIAIATNNSNILVGKRNTSTNTISDWYTISPQDLTIVTPSDGGDSQNQYTEHATLSRQHIDATGEAVTLGTNEEWVFAQGTINDANVTTITNAWYSASGTTDGGLAQANAVLAENRNSFMIYNQGMTYYYTTIRHLGTDPSTDRGYYGVVRNHEYRINVTSIGGFGTPVYDPKHTIVPVIPTSSNTYMRAQINVLDWRVVSQNVDLNTTQSSAKKH